MGVFSILGHAFTATKLRGGKLGKWDVMVLGCKMFLTVLSVNTIFRTVAGPCVVHCMFSRQELATGLHARYSDHLFDSEIDQQTTVVASGFVSFSV